MPKLEWIGKKVVVKHHQDVPVEKHSLDENDVYVNGDKNYRKNPI